MKYINDHPLAISTYYKPMLSADDTGVLNFKLILLIYNTKHTTPEIIHSHINKVHPNLQFTPTFEHNNSISFLDLLIIRHPTQIEIDIFQKPTTDTTINYTSNHPTENKMAAYRYLINRMLSLSLSTAKRIAEWQKKNSKHSKQQ